MAIVAFAGVLSASPAQALALFNPVLAGAEVDVEATVKQAPRWSAEEVDGTGLHDGIQVGVVPGFALTLGAAPDQVAMVQEAVVKAFDAWSNGALTFDVTFDADLSGGDYEITLDTFEGPVGFGSLFGYASNEIQWVPDRLMTNGQRYDGWAITHSDVLLNAANLRWFRAEYGGILTDQGLLDALQKLVMHESGHSIGLDHPTVAPVNLDTDGDPYDAMVIDPLAPWTGLMPVTAGDEDSIMSGLAYGASFASLFNVVLHGDDAAGRDVLYPVVPEPTVLVQLALAGLALARVRCPGGGGRAGHGGEAPWRVPRPPAASLAPEAASRRSTNAA